jgi:hypothetical protein
MGACSGSIIPGHIQEVLCYQLVEIVVDRTMQLEKLHSKRAMLQSCVVV